MENRRRKKKRESPHVRFPYGRKHSRVGSLKRGPQVCVWTLSLSLSLEERYAGKWHELSRASTRLQNDNDDDDNDDDDNKKEEQVRVEREGLAGARDRRVGMRERAS